MSNKHDLSRSYRKCFYKDNHFNYLLALVTTFLNTAISFGATWLLQQTLDTATGISDTYTLKDLAIYIVYFLIFYLILKGLMYISKPRYIKRAMCQFKDYAFKKLTSKNISSFAKESQSAYLSSFSNDMNVIETNYLEAEFLLLRNAVEMTGSFLMMLWYNPTMTLIAMAFLSFPMCGALLQGKKLETIEQQVSKDNENFLAVLKDSLSGFSVIKSFRAEKAIRKLIDGEVKQVEDDKCRRRQTMISLEAIAGSAANLAEMGTFVVGAYLVMKGKGMTPGILLAFMDLTNVFIAPVEELPTFIGNRRSAYALIEKLANKLEQNVREAEFKIGSTLNQAIEVKDLNFGYESDKPILKNINFKFEKGKHYCLVGASGSGKSTLLNLLMGGDNYTGSILYDEHELKTINSKSLYQLVSIIQQNVFIFNATIVDNITMFNDFDSEDIKQAIIDSGLSELINDKGQDYLCGENGCNLSGGEKQRIAIARSLLRKTHVLYVDEATAALDKKTANQVSQAILDLKDITEIVITHSLDANLLSQYDCLIALKNGEIVETGTFEELMRQKNYFYSLYTVSQ